MLTNIKSVYKTFVSKYLIYALAAMAAVNGAGWYITSLKLETAKQAVQTEHNGRLADQASYRAAAAEAKAKNLEEVKKINEENDRKAEVSDDRYDALRKLYDANLVQYARDQATKRNSGSVLLSEHTTTAGGGYVTSESTEISISFEDAGICAENTARIQSVKEWADSLKQEQQ